MKTEIKFSKRECNKIIAFMKEWIEYRGGMGNRIDGFDILDYFKNKTNKGAKRMK